MQHPDHIHGAAVLTDSTAMDDLLRRLQDGYPEKGWSGDKNLALAFNRETQRWEIWRLEHDREYRLVMRSRPGLPVPDNVIDWLVAHDTHRGYNFAKEVAQDIENTKAAQDARFREAIAPAHEKAYWAARRDGMI